MSLIQKMMKQTAVYWPFESYDSDGTPLYGSPTEIICRWEETHQEYIAPNGDKKVSKSIVYVPMDTPVKGMLCLGTIEELGSSEPFSNPETWEIKQFVKLPNLRNTEVLRIAYL